MQYLDRSALVTAPPSSPPSLSSMAESSKVIRLRLGLICEGELEGAEVVPGELGEGGKQVVLPAARLLWLILARRQVGVAEPSEPTAAPPPH